MYVHYVMRKWAWDSRKSDKTFEERGFDFEYAIKIFEGRIVLRSSDREEKRILAIGQIENRFYAVIYTKRGDPRHRRVISARRARKNEEEFYRNRRK